MSSIPLREDDTQEFTCPASSSTLDITVCKIQQPDEDFELRQRSGISPILPSLQSQEAFLPKVVGTGEFSGPWLPPEAKTLVDKLRVNVRLSSFELLKLMDIVANRATEHFGLPSGKFAAITITGKIVELADTKLELLKRVQAAKYSEQTFVWKTGSDSFSGRI